VVETPIRKPPESDTRRDERKLSEFPGNSWLMIPIHTEIRSRVTGQKLIIFLKLTARWNLFTGVVPVWHGIRKHPQFWFGNRSFSERKEFGSYRQVGAQSGLPAPSGKLSLLY
jgi:hypothetical protein